MFDFQGFEQLGRERMQGIADSAGSLQQGVQEIATAVGEITRKAVEDSNVFVGKLTSASSLSEAVEMQSEFARASIEALVANTREISDLYASLAAQVMKPFA